MVELSLDGTHAIRVVPTGGGHRAEPVTLVDGSWIPAVAGDGSGLAVLHRLRNRMAVEEGFRVMAGSWVAVDGETERAMGVDQTHASWVVGERVVVKWMTETLVGPHPAADRLRRLSEVGFAESPALVGVVEWREPETGTWVPLVIVQAYLPDTEDGWVWGLESARRGLGLLPVDPADPHPGFGMDLGDLVGRMHLALADDPPARMSPDLAQRCADDALATLGLALQLIEPYDAESFALLSRHRHQIEPVLARLSEAAGMPVLPLHGDLHVGQLLRDGEGRYAIVDFDGQPTLPPELRAAPAPAARDVAQLLVSIENVEHVVRHYAPDLPDQEGLMWTTHEQVAFIDGYREALGDQGGLFEPALVAAYDWDQVCREIVYAAQRDFTEWMYVPAAELRRRLVPSV